MKLLSTKIAIGMTALLAQNVVAEEKKKLRIIGEETKSSSMRPTARSRSPAS